MQNLVLENPEVQQIENETTSLLIQAKQYQVTTAEQYQTVGNELMRIKGMRKRLDEMFDPGIKAAHEAHKVAVANKKKYTDQLDQAESTIKRALLVYNQEQQRIAREKEAELRRLAEEQAAREREKLLKQAVKAEEKGNDGKAEELFEQAENVIPLTPIVTPQVQKVEGIATRKTWKAVVDNPQLVPAYFNGIELRSINQSALNKLASMSSGNVQVPGVRFVQEESFAAKAAV
jgi:hypothetical protein